MKDKCIAIIKQIIMKIINYKDSCGMVLASPRASQFSYFINLILTLFMLSVVV